MIRQFLSAYSDSSHKSAFEDQEYGEEMVRLTFHLFSTYDINTYKREHSLSKHLRVLEWLKSSEMHLCPISIPIRLHCAK